MKLLTNSSARTFRRCAREYQFSYVFGVRPLVEAEPLRFGHVTHKGLEQVWRGESVVDLSAHAERVDPYELVRVEEMLRGYLARWGPPQDVVAIEVEFEVPLVNPATGRASRTWRVGGKLDAVGYDDGTLAIVEHKTSSSDISPGSDYYRQLRLDPQVSTYFMGARALGHDVERCMYDVLGKPALRPLRATPEDKRKYRKDGSLYANQRTEDETPDEFRERVRDAIAAEPDRYYQRATVVRLADEERDAAHDLWQTARLIRGSELADRWPRNPDACVRYGRTCTFFDVCTGCASLDDPMLFRPADRIHEELTPQEDAA
jgi:hypothetical protein